MTTTRSAPSLGLLLGVAALVLASAAWAGPDPRYYDYDEVLDLFDQWAEQYPEIFHREIIGYTTVDHEPIWAAKISDNAAQHEPEARLIFHAAQHSNEPNGTNAIIYMMDRLLTRYGQQSYYTEMVDNLEMWFIPIVNVDGHRIVFSGGDNWEWWRKTKRDNDNNGEYTYPEDGVDPNRNWDYRWAEYDSTDYHSSRYKGPYPFSESEVVAIRDLVLRERPVILMDFHSPDRPEIGRKVWWVWYDPDYGQYGPDKDYYQPISEALAARTESEIDGVYYNGSGASYNRLPKEQCWVYANTGICVLLMEISRQFWWTGAMIDTIAARVGRGNFYLMERVLNGPGLTGFVTDALTGVPLEAEGRVLQAHDPDIGPRMTEQYFGQYWRLLTPGSYTVSVYAEDHYSQTRTVYVSAIGWTHLDFQLDPDPAASPDIEPVRGEEVIWSQVPLTLGGRVFYRLASAERVWFDFFDAGGRRVLTLGGFKGRSGLNSVRLAGLPESGCYTLRVRGESTIGSTRVIVLR